MTRERQIKPAAHAVTVNRRDHNLRTGLDQIEKPLPAPRKLDGGETVKRRDFFQIRSGGKRFAAAAVNDDDANLRRLF